jgi:hypothetical protein
MDATQLAAWPQDAQDETSNERLGAQLLARLRKDEALCTEKRLQVLQIQADIERLETQNGLLREVLRGWGLIEPELKPEPQAPVDAAATPPIFQVPENGARTARPNIKEFVAGNRGDKTPPRRPEFEAVSLADAARRFGAAGQDITLDQLAESIFVIKESKDRQAAKGSLRTTMANGVERGDWERVSPGVFRLTAQGAL